MSRFVQQRFGPVLSRSLLLYFCLILALPPVPALAADCADDIAEAEESYTLGDFDHAIDLLKACLNQTDLDPKAREEAYRLIGMTYIAKDYQDDAKQAIKELLVLVPDYMPNPDIDPVPYVQMVEQIKQEQDPNYVPPSEQQGSKKGLFTKILVGVGAVVAAVLLLGGGGDDDPEPVSKDLPSPPDLP